MTTSYPIGSPAAGLRGVLLDGRLLSNLSTVSFTSLLSLQPPAGAGAGRLASPVLPTRSYYAYDTRMGSPPASPAAGPRGATLVGSVLSRLCSAA